MKIARITQNSAQRVVDSQEDMVKSLAGYIDLLTKKTMNYLDDTQEIHGCFLKVMDEFFTKYNKNFKEKDVLGSNESDLVDFASDKIIAASQLLFEAITVGTVLAIAKKEAADVLNETDA